MIFKMKVAKKGAFMITITINLSSSKVRCGPSTIYWKLRQIFNQEIKLVVFPGLHIFSSGLENHCFVLFCQEIAQNIVDSWWVSGADQQYNECILLKFETWDGSHLLLIISAILRFNFFMFTFKTVFFIDFSCFS